jgi:hypothetical protein
MAGEVAPGAKQPIVGRKLPIGTAPVTAPTLNPYNSTR